MYESPITIFTRTLRKEISEKRDECIFATIEEELGCEVDREELIKALAYDRDQYRKGYEDGKACSPLIITNADRIRAMPDAELAEWLSNTDADFPPNYPNGVSVKLCETSWLDWLRQEADHGRPD